MLVGTGQGQWMVPADRAVWIPGGVDHHLRMISNVTTVTLWVEPDAHKELPTGCEVVDMSPLMRALLTAAVDIGPEYNVEGRDGHVMSLLLHELLQLPKLRLCLTFPKHRKLAALCQEFLDAPRPHDTIEQWAETLHMSRRTFTRLFKKETGTSFVLWRQQACLFSALPRLAAGESVIKIAIELGYESPAAFTTMFKRLQGMPPSQYFERAGG